MLPFPQVLQEYMSRAASISRLLDAGIAPTNPNIKQNERVLAPQAGTTTVDTLYGMRRSLL